MTGPTARDAARWRELEELANQPATTTTSCRVVMIAATANFHSNRNEM